MGVHQRLLPRVAGLWVAITSLPREIARAAEADYDYELLRHQSDAALRRWGLTRADVARAIYVIHFK